MTIFTGAASDFALAGEAGSIVHFAAAAANQRPSASSKTFRHGEPYEIEIACLPRFERFKPGISWK